MQLYDSKRWRPGGLEKLFTFPFVCQRQDSSGPEIWPNSKRFVFLVSIKIVASRGLAKFLLLFRIRVLMLRPGLALSCVVMTMAVIGLVRSNLRTFFRGLTSFVGIPWSSYFTFFAYIDR